MLTKLKLAVFVFFACFLSFLFGASIFSINTVWAGAEEYRQCADNELCEIGEYLFDDSYTPIATASCTLTSRNPSGNLYLDEVAMTAQSDGWYSLDVTTVGQDYGLYRSQVCCTHESEYICIDKSFEIATSSSGLTETQVATAVWDATRLDYGDAGSFGENLQNSSSVTVDEIWDAPERSLTSFGTLTADIWSYSSRSINNLTDLVSSIWDSSDRTLTDADLGSGELATKTQVETMNTGVSDLDTQVTELSQEVRTNRYFLEQLVNAPIIETFIEEGEDSPVDLQAKIRETKKIARFLSIDASDLNKQIASLNTGWDDTSYQIALNEMTTASRVLGASTQGSIGPDSISARITWLDQKWRGPIIGNLSTQTTSALANVSSISREVKSYGKTFISKQYLDIAEEHINKLKSAIGKEGDSFETETLFGYIADLERISDILVKQSLELDEILQNWNAYTNNEKEIKLARIQRTVLSVNQIVEAESLLKPRVNDELHRENLALSLQGLINSNLIFLAQDSSQVLQNIWLEHGSVIFRSLVINPSDILAQNVKIKYYLPQEIGSEHIVSMEDGLEVIFDAERNSLYVSGEVILQPEETRTFIVEVVDVWIIPEGEIASIRKQTETLFKSLEGTSYFAQGSTIKADIEVNLDKIALLQENIQTPEMKIKAHREAMLELESAKSKLNDLKTIVSSAGSIGTVFGFVGGVQAIAVWGLIIILVAGFVFLAIYLKMIVKPAVQDGGSQEAGGSSADSLEADFIKNSGSKNKSTKKSKASKKIMPSKSRVKAEKKLIQEKIASQSTWSLLKEVILMKLGLSAKPYKKPTKKKKIVLLILLIVSSVIFLFIILLSSQTSSSDVEMVSPLPSLVMQTTPVVPVNDRVSGEAREGALGHEKTLIAVRQDNLSNKGLVLGKTQDQEVELEEELDQNSDLHELARVNIPSGYNAINVRVSSKPASEIVSRLYINQDVFILQQKDDWVLIKTVNVDETKTIQGWILEDFISEIKQQ